MAPVSGAIFLWLSPRPGQLRQISRSGRLRRLAICSLAYRVTKIRTWRTKTESKRASGVWGGDGPDRQCKLRNRMATNGRGQSLRKRGP